VPDVNDVADRVAAIVGQPVVAIDEIHGAGGYTTARRLVATLSDGTTWFVKAAVDAPTTRWLVAERRAYETLGTVPFAPSFVGADDCVLVLEDLRHGHWPPPWRPGDIDRVLATLDDLSSTVAPDWAEPVSSARGGLRRWATLADEPATVVAHRTCTFEWLERALPVLIDAERAAPLDGDGIVHLDVRSDNLCLLDDRIAIVDWNLLCRSAPGVDAAFFLPTVTLDGGPPPPDDVHPGLAAVVAGCFADWARLVPVVGGERVLAHRLAMFQVCLPWAARVLGLPPPT
jgi:hypothetical protein